MSYNTKLDSLNIAATRVAITVKYSSILTGIIVLMLSFNKGGHWIENEVIPPLQLISTYSIVVGTPVGLFLVFFKPLRLVAASLFIILAYTWGISVWVYSLIIAVRMSGLLLLAIGLLFFGLGVIPVAVLGALLSAEWVIAASIAGAGVLILVFRKASFALVNSVVREIQMHEDTQDQAHESAETIPKSPVLRNLKTGQSSEIEIFAEILQEYQNDEPVDIAAMDALAVNLENKYGKPVDELLAIHLSGETLVPKTSSHKGTEGYVAHAFAVAWNRLDTSELEPFLAEDIHYASQNVFEELEGKKVVLEYLKTKIQTIKGAASNYSVYAELGETQSYPAGRPCVLLSQGDVNNIDVLVLFEVEEDKVKRIDLCTVAPHPSTARRTGNYPV